MVTPPTPTRTEILRAREIQRTMGIPKEEAVRLAQAGMVAAEAEAPPKAFEKPLPSRITHPPTPVVTVPPRPVVTAPSPRPVPTEIEVTETARIATKQVQEAEVAQRRLRQLGIPEALEREPQSLVRARSRLEDVTRGVDLGKPLPRQQYTRIKRAQDVYSEEFGRAYKISPQELESRIARAKADKLFEKAGKEQMEAEAAIAQYERVVGLIPPPPTEKPFSLLLGEAGFEFAGKPVSPIPFERGQLGFMPLAPRPPREIVGRAAMVGATIVGAVEQPGIELARLIKPESVARLRPALSPITAVTIPEYRRRYLGAGIAGFIVTAPLEAKALAPVVRVARRVATPILRPIGRVQRISARVIAKRAPRPLQIALEKHLRTTRVRRAVPVGRAEFTFEQLAEGDVVVRGAAKVKFVPKGKVLRVAREKIVQLRRRGGRIVTPETQRAIDITEISGIPSVRQRITGRFVRVLPERIRRPARAILQPRELKQVRRVIDDDILEVTKARGRITTALGERRPVEIEKIVGTRETTITVRGVTPIGRERVIPEISKTYPTKLPEGPEAAGRYVLGYDISVQPRFVRGGVSATGKVARMDVLTTKHAHDLIGKLEPITKRRAATLRADIGGGIRPAAKPTGRFAAKDVGRLKFFDFGEDIFIPVQRDISFIGVPTATLIRARTRAGFGVSPVPRLKMRERIRQVDNSLLKGLVFPTPGVRERTVVGPLAGMKTASAQITKAMTVAPTLAPLKLDVPVPARGLPLMFPEEDIGITETAKERKARKKIEHGLRLHPIGDITKELLGKPRKGKRTKKRGGKKWDIV